MPLHRLFHPENVFSAEDKQGIAERITAIYTAGGLPAFYVVVIFIPVPENSFFVGGKTANNFVRIVSQHLARTMDTPERKASTVQKLEDAFAPYIKERSLDWELHIEEVDRATWRENGIAPPLPGTDAEKLWVRLDKAVPY